MGPYCDYCDRRCFLQRAYPAESGWKYTLMATCDRGRQNDREKTGYDFRTAANPVTDPRFAESSEGRLDRMANFLAEDLRQRSDLSPRVYSDQVGRLIVELPGPQPGFPERIFRVTIEELPLNPDIEEESS